MQTLTWNKFENVRPSVGTKFVVIDSYGGLAVVYNAGPFFVDRDGEVMSTEFFNQPESSNYLWAYAPPKTVFPIEIPTRVVTGENEEHVIPGVYLEAFKPN